MQVTVMKGLLYRPLFHSIHWYFPPIPRGSLLSFMSFILIRGRVSSHTLVVAVGVTLGKRTLAGDDVLRNFLHGRFVKLGPTKVPHSKYNHPSFLSFPLISPRPKMGKSLAGGHEKKGRRKIRSALTTNDDFLPPAAI